MSDSIPKSKRKKELQELLNKKGGFSCHTVRKVINEVIVELRLVSYKEATDTKTVYPKEVERILGRFS